MGILMPTEQECIGSVSSAFNQEDKRPLSPQQSVQSVSAINRLNPLDLLDPFAVGRRKHHRLRLCPRQRLRLRPGCRQPLTARTPANHRLQPLRGVVPTGVLQELPGGSRLVPSRLKAPAASDEFAKDETRGEETGDSSGNVGISTLIS